MKPHLSWLKNYNLLIFDQIDSTNSEGLRLVKNGISGDHIIWAKHQTAGRGRNNKNWESKEGNFFASIILDQNIYIQHQPQFSFIASLAVRECLLEIAKEQNILLDIDLKWPNDVLIGLKKISGILLESITLEGRSYLIIGIGINVNHHPDNAQIDATDLYNEGIKINDIDKLLDCFMSNFHRYRLIWEQHGFENIRLDWLKHALKLGKIVCVDDGNTKVSGIFRDIDSSGAIKIELSGGNMYSVSSCDVG